MPKDGRYVITLKDDAHFGELREYLDQLDSTSYTTPTNMLRHLILRGWLDLKQQEVGDLSLVNPIKYKKPSENLGETQTQEKEKSPKKPKLTGKIMDLGA